MHIFVRNGLPVLNQRKLIFSGIAVYVLLGRMMDLDDCLNCLYVFCGRLLWFVVVYGVLWWFVVCFMVFSSVLWCFVVVCSV